MLKLPSHCSFKPDLHELWSKEGVGVKLRIKLSTTNPLKVRVKWASIGRAIHCWKDLFEAYKILPSHSQKRLDFRKIWMSKVLGHQES
jgi:hypothetical protein